MHHYIIFQQKTQFARMRATDQLVISINQYALLHPNSTPSPPQQRAVVLLQIEGGGGGGGGPCVDFLAYKLLRLITVKFGGKLFLLY